MGMYDYIECEYPLPGEPPAWASLFQTKDLDCGMGRYTITADGHLKGEGDFTGAINFYASNIVASGPGVYTRDGEDAESVEYCAVFVAGKLMSLTETEHTKRPAAKHKPRHFAMPTEEEIAAMEERRNELMTGRQVYVLWGGQDSGYYGKVVYDGKNDLVIETADGEIEKIGRYQRDGIFFDSYEEAMAHKAERANAWRAEKEEYEREVARKPVAG